MTITEWCPVCKKPDLDHTEEELIRCIEILRLETDFISLDEGTDD